MILVTVGTQLPFDRLISAIDALAPSLSQPVAAQTGKSEFKPKNIEYFANMDSREFDRRFCEARAIIAHAGIGTVLTARKYGKPIVLVPRRVQYGEHRNDHQLATCTQLHDKTGIFIAENVENLADAIAAALGFEQHEPQAPTQNSCSEFARRLGEFVLTDKRAAATDRG